MELQQLRYFTAVSKHRNFTRAAEECNVSQPALSIQIQKLEAELGGPLFHRQGRTIVLTDVGQRLLAKAESLLRLHQSTLDEVKDAAQAGGEAHFGATLTIAPYLIPHVVEAPDGEEIPRFTMEENFTEGLLAKIEDGTLDFAIMSSPVEVPKLLVKVIAREPFLFVMPSGHRLAKRKVVSLQEAKKEPFLPLSQIHCAGRQISDFYRSGRPAAHASFESAQIETILKLVRQGRGITLLPKMAVVDSLDESLCWRPVAGGQLQREITLAHHPDRYLCQSARTLMGRIERCLNVVDASE